MLIDNKNRMTTSSNGNMLRVTGPLCGEFTGPGEFPTQRPVTRSFCVYFDLHLNKRSSKQSWGWWFETLSRSLWRHRNASCYQSHSAWTVVLQEIWLYCRCYRPVAQTPLCASPISHSGPLCNRNVPICAHFCYKMVEYLLSDALFDERYGTARGGWGGRGVVGVPVVSD